MDIDSQVSDLCVSCGFCCDGTLFLKAQLYEGDEQAFKDLPLLSKTETKDRIQLPCPYFDCKCTVYDKIRPKICGKYFCNQIKEFRENKTSFDEVSKLIQKVKGIKKEIYLIVDEFYPQLQNKPATYIVKEVTRNKSEFNSTKQGAKLTMSVALLNHNLLKFAPSKKKKTN